MRFEINHSCIVDSHHLIVRVSSDQSFAVRNGRPCVKSHDSDLSQPVNEYPHCAHDIYNGNVIEREEEACTREIKSGGLPTLLHETLTLQCPRF